MKFSGLNGRMVEAEKSLPVRGAWIEILLAFSNMARTVSLPVRGAWIEIAVSGLPETWIKSLPVRGAWIEM